MKKFDKILIANRGEIALRIMRTVRDLGMKSVAVYTKQEGRNGFAAFADEAVCLGDGDLSETYLNIQKIVDIALETGAQAIHPGYGFLSENPELARACIQNKLVFIGPSVDVLEQMGNKVKAKEIARLSGVNVLESTPLDVGNIKESAKGFRYPVLIKASYGGGGKGMHVAENQSELVEKAIQASRSAQSYFGNGEIFVESYVRNARHVEVQVLGDRYGNVIHLYERDCTVQRNHQKIIEEAPAAFLSETLRNELHRAALSICKRIAYENAGTVEFLVDEEGRFFFLEMNPRIQVEHPVTEEITAVDIVREQLLLAAGNPLSIRQDEVQVKGHAIQCRVYAEDPENNFAPSGQPLDALSWPVGDVRMETHLQHAGLAGVQFDPLLGKIITHGVDRDHAALKMTRALSETFILGPKTNVALLASIIQSKDYRNNNLSTNYCAFNKNALLNQVHEQRKKVKIDYLLAGALHAFFYSSYGDKSTDTLYAGMAYWRLFNVCSLRFEDKVFSLEFEQRATKLFFTYDKTQVASEVEISARNTLKISIAGQSVTIRYHVAGKARVVLEVNHQRYAIERADFLNPHKRSFVDKESDAGENLISSHLFGKIVNVNVQKDQTVNKGEVLMIIESMKSENAIMAPKKAKIKSIEVEVGTQVIDQMPLVYLEDL